MKASSIAAFIALGLTLSACNYIEPPPTDYAVAYPFQAQQDRAVDIQVIRKDTLLTFTNTTPSVLPAGRLWVNQAFSRPVEAIAVGESVSYSLYDFRNRFDEPFRAGGFFATRTPLDVVMVQHQAGGDGEGGEIVGLVVADGKAKLR